MSFQREFGLVRKWDKIRWESHHFLSKCHDNSMTWTYPKSMSCSSMENKKSLDKWHGMVMKFGVNLDQTATKSSCDEKWHGISSRIHVTFFTGYILYERSTTFYIKELPCKKCDMDSHGHSTSFLVTTRLGGSLVQIDTKFHDDSMSFIQVLFVSHTGTLYGL